MTNRFRLLIKKAASNKHSTVMYYDDIWTSSPNPSAMEHNETGETIFESRMEILSYLNNLSEFDSTVYKLLIHGFTLSEMEQNIGIARSEITAAILRIDALRNDLKDK